MMTFAPVGRTATGHATDADWAVCDAEEYVATCKYSAGRPSGCLSGVWT